MSEWCLLCGPQLERNDEILYHRFPKVKRIHQKWLSFCGEVDWRPHSALCSLHFCPEDYILQDRQKILRPDAVPSIPLTLLKHKVRQLQDIRNNFDRICRVCLGRQNLVPVNNLDRTLKEVADGDVDTKTTLPQQLCEVCVQELSISILFKQKLTSSTNFLVKISDFFHNAEDTVREHSYAINYDKLCRNMKLMRKPSLDRFDDVEEQDLTDLSTIEQPEEAESEINNAPELINPDITNDIESTVKEIDSMLDKILDKVNECKENDPLEWHDDDDDDENVTINTALSGEISGLLNQIENILKQEDPEPIADSNNKSKKKKLKPNISYQCTNCSRSFHYKKFLQAHIREEHPKPKSKPLCYICGKNVSNLKMHIETHGNEEKYTCKECGIKKHSLGAIRLHLRTHHGTPAYLCEFCPRTFASKYKYEFHRMAVHFAEKPFECQLCKKCFAREAGLKDHMNTHTGERPYRCKLCVASYGCKSTYFNHLKWHKLGAKTKRTKPTNRRKRNSSKDIEDEPLELSVDSDEPPSGNKEANYKPEMYFCSFCPKTFVFQHNLKRHELGHQEGSSIKKEACPHCDKRFKDKWHLRKHISVHTNARPYKCQICFKAFKQQYHLSNHLSVHSNVRFFKCGICGQAFKRKANCKVHLARHEKDEMVDKIQKKKSALTENQALEVELKEENGEDEITEEYDDETEEKIEIMFEDEEGVENVELIIDEGNGESCGEEDVEID